MVSPFVKSRHLVTFTRLQKCIPTLKECMVSLRCFVEQMESCTRHSNKSNLIPTCGSFISHLPSHRYPFRLHSQHVVWLLTLHCIQQPPGYFQSKQSNRNHAVRITNSDRNQCTPTSTAIKYHYWLTTTTTNSVSAHIITRCFRHHSITAPLPQQQPHQL